MSFRSQPIKPPTDRQIGEVYVSTEHRTLRLHADAWAYHNAGSRHYPENSLMVLSAIAQHTDAKSLHAILATKGKPKIKLESPDGKPVWAVRHAEGYRCYRQTFGGGWCHVLLIAKEPSLMLASNDAALWQQIRRDDITTPVLREWVPWIREQLMSLEYCSAAYGRDVEYWLHPLPAFQCEPAIMHASTRQLDQLVSRAVLDGHLRIT